MRAVNAARPYWFEIFTVANFIVLEIVFRRIGLSAFAMLPKSLLMFAPTFALQALLGIAIRAAVSRARGGDYMRVVKSREFLTDVVRIVFFSALFAHVYGWIKVAVPALNPRLYDQAFWDLDRTLFFGLSPNVFFVNLFSRPWALRAVDWSYAEVFLGSVFAGGAFFISSPEKRLRVLFANTNSTLWLVGAWLYVAFPAFDPCYRFPAIWLPLAPWLTQTQLLQRFLMTNYLNFTHYAYKPVPLSLLYGLSAFPSLHVAYAFLLFLLMRGVSRVWRTLFAIVTIIIFVGSLVTGWHYMVDGLAGLLLAAACWAAFQRPLPRFHRHAPTD